MLPVVKAGEGFWTLEICMKMFCKNESVRMALEMVIF